MAEHLLPSDSSPDEQDKFLELNLDLQRAMLLLVECCHRPDSQATLEGSLEAMNHILTPQQASNPFTASMKRILGTVLSACFDMSREKTLANMRAGFLMMDAALSLERERQ